MVEPGATRYRPRGKDKKHFRDYMRDYMRDYRKGLRRNVLKAKEESWVAQRLAELEEPSV
jgi:hypothetical protein